MSLGDTFAAAQSSCRASVLPSIIRCSSTLRLRSVMGSALSVSDPLGLLARTSWCSAAEIMERAFPGDIIEFQRAGYGHYGVYVGEGYVVNYTRKTPSVSLIRKQTVVQVSCGDQCRVNNLEHSVNFQEPFASEEIVRRAESKIGRTFQGEDCECFATWCRYGQSFTCQPKDWSTPTKSITPVHQLCADWPNEVLLSDIYDPWSAV